MASAPVTDLRKKDQRKLDSTFLRLKGKLGRVSSLHMAEGIHLVSTAVRQVQDVYDMRICHLDYVSRRVLKLLQTSSQVLKIACQLLNSLMEKREEITKIEPCVLLFISDTIQACQPTLGFFRDYYHSLNDNPLIVSRYIIKTMKPHAANMSDSINILLYRVFKSLTVQHPQSQETHTFLNNFSVSECFGPSAPAFTTVFTGKLKNKIQSDQEDLSYLLGNNDSCAVCNEDMAEGFAVLDACRHTLCIACAESCFMSRVVHDGCQAPRCPFCRTEVGDWTTSDLITSEIRSGLSPMKITQDDDLVLEALDAAEAMVAYVQRSKEFSPFFLSIVVKHYEDRELFESALF